MKQIHHKNVPGSTFVGGCGIRPRVGRAGGKVCGVVLYSLSGGVPWVGKPLSGQGDLLCGEALLAENPFLPALPHLPTLLGRNAEGPGENANVLWPEKHVKP